MSLFWLSNSDEDDSPTRENVATKKETISPRDLKLPWGGNTFARLIHSRFDGKKSFAEFPPFSRLLQP